MSKGKITRRQKNISRLLREKKRAYSGKLKARDGKNAGRNRWMH